MCIRDRTEHFEIWQILQFLRHLQNFLLNFHENCWCFKPIFCENFEIAAVQKDANLVDLEKCCRTHIFLQNFVLIQPRTSPQKICKIVLIFSILLTLTPNPVEVRAAGVRDSGPALLGVAGTRYDPHTIVGEFRQNVARFRLYRHRFLQENTRFAAFFKIYKNIKLNFLKFYKFCDICNFFAEFPQKMLIFQTDSLRKFWECSGAKGCKSCRAWKMLSNAYFLAKFRFDTAENEPAKNLQNFANFGRRRLKKRSEKTENARSKRKHRKGRGTSGREEAQPPPPDVEAWSSSQC